MTDKPLPEKSLDRKRREAAALKANLKKRKEQAKSAAKAEDSDN